MSETIGLLISDVDGTLVNHAKALTPGTIAAVRRLEAAGLPFTIISARPPSGLEKIARTLGISVPMAAFNGGTLIRPDGTIAERHGVDDDVVRGLFAMIDGRGPTPWIFADGHWFTRDPANPHVARECLSSDQDPVIVTDMAPHMERVDKLTWVSDDAPLLAALSKEAIAAYGKRATIAQSQTYYLDITAPLANKGDGVAALAAAIGVDLTATAVIGDMPNDLPMFARAGLAIAMGQAPEEVRSRAAFVTASNDEDGVAQAIERIILPRIKGNRP
jgi:Cof subfamily protein (haloacid dehalogenase superfamily)